PCVYRAGQALAERTSGELLRQAKRRTVEPRTVLHRGRATGESGRLSGVLQPHSAAPKFAGARPCKLQDKRRCKQSTSGNPNTQRWKKTGDQAVIGVQN